MPLWVRPQMFPPDHTVTTLSSFSSVDVSIERGILAVIPSGLSSQPEAWVLSSGAVSAAGKPVTAVPEECMQVARGKASHSDLLTCLTSHGVWVAVTYQPASRYWAFQLTETAIYLALALALTGYCFWRLVRRLS
jgi:hypothetical protein